MDLPVHRVQELACPSCGHTLDPKAYKPLSTTACPSCDAPVAVPAQFDTYRLIRFLGSGGTGFVMEAFDQNLHRRVAIKVLRSGGDADKVALEATREARSLAKLNHPGIVHIYSLGEYQGHKYIVMELLSSGSAKRFTERSARLDERATLDLAIAVAEGLAAAQKVGLVHMDVKPGNILYDERGEARLIDFGAAQFARMRKNAGVVGTPYYIAPEVARGGVPDFKADIYSLGASLFHILTGDPPFDGSDPNSVILARLKRPAPAVHEHRPEVNPATAAVIGRMLASNPDDRYAGYDELLDDLRGARKAIDDPTGMAGAALSAAVTQPRHVALAQRKRKSRVPAWAPIAVVAVVLVGFLTALAPLFSTNPVNPNPATPDTPDKPTTPGTPETPGPPQTPGPVGATPPAGSGRAFREIWRNLPGDTVDSVIRGNRLDKAPSEGAYATSLALSVSVGENYAQRIRGYLFAPYTGAYRFILCADDDAQVFLSPDANPSAKKLVARTTKPLPPGQYTDPGDPVQLKAGQRYYFETLHKQGAGSDHLIVGWVLPDGSRQTPIRDNLLLPLARGFATLDSWRNTPAKDTGALGQLTASVKPDSTGLVDRTEQLDDAGPRVVRRVRGFIRVPTTGQYVFELNAAGVAGLWLAPNDNPQTRKAVADITANNKRNDWAAAKSTGKIDLDAETPYYFELIHVNPNPGGFVQLGLRHPDGFIEQPIPGASLSPAE